MKPQNTYQGRAALLMMAISIALLTTSPVRGEEFPRNLSYGSRSESVRHLQQFLRGAGFYSGPITGNFLSMTRDAVRRFQKASNLPATGFFGPLSRELARRMSAPTTPDTTPTLPLSISIAPSSGTPTDIITAPTPFSGCVQMDASRNNLSERRINLVFVGANYVSLNDFVEVVKQAADVNAQTNGLFSVEPFRSNRDKFNILYTTNIASLSETADAVPFGETAVGTMRALLATCNYQNRFGFILVNTRKGFSVSGIAESRSGIANATPPEPSGLSSFPFPLRDADELRRLQGLVLHEGAGHTIGNLFDEYVTVTWAPSPATIQQSYPTFQNQCYVVEPSALSCQQIGGGIYSCNFAASAQTEQTCIAQSAWHDLIGNGCGRDGIVDCTDQDPNYLREIRCWPARCSVNSFGSVGAGIMESALDVRNFFFGAQNERLICRRIQELTGRVGGTCNSLCLSGCPVGQYCSAGVCRPR